MRQQIEKLLVRMLLLGLFAIGTCRASDDKLSCEQVDALVKMIGAKTSDRLGVYKKSAGENYIVQLVYAARSVELHPKNHLFAEQLLGLIPTSDSDSKFDTWVTFSDPLCDQRATDLKVLTKLETFRAGLFHDLANAALVIPEKLFDYIKFSLITGWPESDNAVQMEVVCKKLHDKFIENVNMLDEHDRKLFTEHVLEPKTCTPLQFPEE